MAILKLLGGATLETEAGPLGGPAAQRRRMALLARLALAGMHGVSRDKLVAYLWAESDTEKGRHLLSDSIYRINQALGDEAVVAWGDQLRLDPAVLPSDVAEFEAALERGDRAAATRSYRGPFLDGFFVEGAAELERWIEGERERLSHAYAGALEYLAEEASQSGGHREAVSLWRRASVHDPFSSRIALRLVEALVASGDHAAALQQARVHEALLREEWGEGPAAEFAGVVVAMRTGADARAQAPPAGSRAGASDDDAQPSPATAPAPALLSEAPPAPPAKPPRRGIWLALLLTGAALATAAIWFALRPAGSRSGPVTLAVLPLTDLSPEGDQEYFADGMTEELISSLNQIEGLRVSSRTSVFALKGQSIDARAVGARLRVSRVVDGSVRKSGNRVRISVQLADAETGYQLWSAAYERELADIFSIQEDLARAIARALRIRLGTDGPRGPGERTTENVEAYNLYLRGRYHWHRRDPAGLRSAVAAFEDAVRQAPTYGRAWAGLADAYAILGFYDWADPKVAFPRAREAALRARESEEMRAEAEATLGYVRFYFEWDWTGAEEYFRTAIRLAPGSSKAHQWYGNLLTAMGRFDEAEREMRQAMVLEPLSLIANAALCWVWTYARRFEEAIAQCGRTIELDSDFGLAHLWRGWAWTGVTRWDSAAASFDRANTLSGGGTLALSARGYAAGRNGDRPRATMLLDSLRARRKAGYEPAYEIAKAALGAGRREEAVAWLDTAVADRAHSMVFLKVDPVFDELRSDPRFIRLLRRVGLP